MIFLHDKVKLIPCYRVMQGQTNSVLKGLNNTIAHSCGRLKVELFNDDDIILLFPVFFAQFLFSIPKWQTHASLCCLLCLGKPNCVLSAKFIHADYLRGDIIRQLAVPLSRTVKMTRSLTAKSGFLAFSK